jgi:hypothetical protein
VVPANVVATIGQTSLLGSMHVALNPSRGQAPAPPFPWTAPRYFPRPSRHCRGCQSSSTPAA